MKKKDREELKLLLDDLQIQWLWNYYMNKKRFKNRAGKRRVIIELPDARTLMEAIHLKRKELRCL